MHCPPLSLHKLIQSIVFYVKSTVSISTISLFTLNIHRWFTFVSVCERETETGKIQCYRFRDSITCIYFNTNPLNRWLESFETCHLVQSLCQWLWGMRVHVPSHLFMQSADWVGWRIVYCHWFIFTSRTRHKTVILLKSKIVFASGNVPTFVLGSKSSHFHLILWFMLFSHTRFPVQGTSGLLNTKTRSWTVWTITLLDQVLSQ